MRKTNFIVVFLLLIALISFVAFLFQIYSVFDSISYLVVPGQEKYSYLKGTTSRALVTSVPMAIFTGTIGILGFRKGLSLYNASGKSE